MSKETTEKDARNCEDASCSFAVKLPDWEGIASAIEDVSVANDEGKSASAPAAYRETVYSGSVLW